MKHHSASWALCESLHDRFTCFSDRLSNEATPWAWLLAAAALFGVVSPAYAGWTGGAIPGQFAVNPSGAATYTITLNFPVSVGHLVPKLSLVYNSQHPNGLAGRGWTLSGLSSITRCGQTMAQDGAIEPVTFTVNDDYCLDGQKLMQASDGTFRTELDNFTQISSMCGGGTGTLCQWFKARLKNGLTYIYGATVDSQILAQGPYFSATNCGAPTHAATRVWALNEIVDRSGNAVTFHYAQDAGSGSTCTGNYWLTSITYSDKANLGTNADTITATGPNTITLSYTALGGWPVPPDLSLIYRGGAAIGNTQLLSGVAFSTTSSGETQSILYDLQYQTDPSTGYSELNAVTECAGQATCTTSNVSPTACPSGDQCFHSTKMNWSASSSGWAGKVTSNHVVGSYPTYESYGFMMDAFGTGRDDFVYAQYSGGSGIDGWCVFGEGPTVAGMTTWCTNQNLFYPDLFTAMPINYYGNGQQSVLQVETDADGNDYWHAITYSPLSGTANLQMTDVNTHVYTQLPVAQNYWDSALAITADVNGDGLDDIIVPGPAVTATSNSVGQFGLMVYLNSTTGFNPQPQQLWVPSGGYSNLSLLWSGSNGYRAGVRLADFNGDGRTDLLVRMNNGDLLALISTGTLSQPQMSIFAVIKDCDPNHQPLLLDANGDGLSDIACVSVKTGDWMLAISTGTAAAGFKIYDTGKPAAYPDQTIVTDHKGVGRQGLMFPTGTDWYIYQPYYDTTSGNWTFFSSYDTGVAVSDFANPLTSQINVLVGDLDGDGSSDLLSFDSSEHFIYALHNTSQFFLSSITDGLGNNTQVNYLPITQVGASSVYPPPGIASYSYPQSAYDGPLYVVNNYTANSGANNASFATPDPVSYTDTFKYKSAAMDHSGRGFLGFATVSMVDGRSGRQITTDYQQSFPYIGMVADQLVYDAAGNNLSATYNTPKYLSTLGTGSTASFPYFITTTVKTWGSGSSDNMSGSQVKFVTITTTMDPYGNPKLLETETNPNQNASSDYYNNLIVRYDEDTTNWCLSLPNAKTIAITSTANPDTSPGTSDTSTDNQARETTYVNDTVNCRMNSETEQALESGESPTTTYTYDSYGNVSDAQVTDSQNNLLRDTTYDFSGTSGIFPTKVTNRDPYSSIDLVTTQQWDLTNGTLLNSNVATSADPTHGLNTAYTYDPFGRKSSETEPDSTSTGWQYSPTATGCTDVFGQNSASYRIIQTHSASDGTPGATLQTCYDSLNRPVMTIRDVLGDLPVEQDTEYNILGLKASESQPHSSTSANSVYWTNTNYDEQNRPSVIHRPVVSGTFQMTGGSKTTFEYNSPSQYAVTQTVQTYSNNDAPASETTIHYYNMVGYSKEVDDAQNQTVYGTDAFGDVIGITDQAGNTTTLVYDSWGHKTGMTDPDMGPWSYAYDALGELTCQTDANTQSTLLGYDNLGRLRSRLVPASGTNYCAPGAPTPTGTPVQWTYDTALYGPGQLASESDNSGFTKTYSYDQYGHSIATDTNAGGVDYQISTGYDKFGRVASVTYPSMPASTDQAPVSNAGGSQLVVLGNDVTLDGSVSNDPDNGPLPLSYTWTQQSGPVNVGIDGSRTNKVTFTPSMVGIYTFQLVVGDGQLTSAATAQVTVNPPVPGAPTVSPTTSTDGNFTLKWNAVPGVGSYYLFQSTDNVNFTQIQTVQDNGTNKEQTTVPGLGNGAYYFAFCSYANGACTNLGASASGVVTIPPGAPTNTLVTPVTVTPNQTYTVKWTKPTSGTWTYYVVRNDNNSGFTSPTDHTITGSPVPNSWPNSTAAVGTYYFKVLACNGDPANGSSGACSAFSNVASVQVLAVPAAPTMHTPNPSTIVLDGSSTLSWTAACCSVTSYTQDASLFSNFSTYNETNQGNVTSETVSPTATKYYRVKACNAMGCGAWSATATVTVTAGNNMMVQPTGTSIQAPSSTTTVAPPPSSGSGGISMRMPTESDGSGLPTLYSEPIQLAAIQQAASASPVPVLNIARRPVVASGRHQDGIAVSRPLHPALPTDAKKRLQKTTPRGISTGVPTLQRLTALRARLSRLPPSLLDPMQQAKWQKRWQEIQHSLAQVEVGQMPPILTAAPEPSGPAEALERARKAAVFHARADDHRSLRQRLTDGDVSVGGKYRVQDASSSTTNLTVDYVYDDQENLEAVVNDADPTLVYWQAQAMDEYGHYTGELYGNGVLTTGVYDDATGAIKGVQTGMGGSTADQNLIYTWDGYGNMATRQDANAGMTETFQYDGLNRIGQSSITGSPANPAPTVLSYSATGDIQSKSDVATTYTPTANHAHLLQSVTTTDGGSVTYSYDNNGNMLSSAAVGTTRMDSRSATWTAQNQPSGISDGANCMSFAYDPDGARYSERSTTGTLQNGTCSGTGSTTLEIGAGFEVITPDGGNPSSRVTIIAAGKAIAVMNVSNTGGPTATLQTSSGASTSNYLNYLHYDSLGNVDTVTDAAGNLIAAQSGGKMSYDIFGQRRDPATWATLSAAVTDTNSTDSGYTSQQQLDNLGPVQGLGLVHMNGRVYDPTLGRFISADPRIPNPYNSQDLNRFAYVDNNPLNSVDPTGFDPNSVCDDSCSAYLGQFGFGSEAMNSLGLYNSTANVTDSADPLSGGALSGVADSSYTITATNPTGNNYSTNITGDPNTDVSSGGIVVVGAALPGSEVDVGQLSAAQRKLFEDNTEVLTTMFMDSGEDATHFLQRAGAFINDYMKKTLFEAGSELYINDQSQLAVTIVTTHSHINTYFTDLAPDGYKPILDSDGYALTIHGHPGGSFFPNAVDAAFGGKYQYIDNGTGRTRITGGDQWHFSNPQDFKHPGYLVLPDDSLLFQNGADHVTAIPYEP